MVGRSATIAPLKAKTERPRDNGTQGPQMPGASRSPPTPRGTWSATPHRVALRIPPGPPMATLARCASAPAASRSARWPPAALPGRSGPFPGRTVGGDLTKCPQMHERRSGGTRIPPRSRGRSHGPSARQPGAIAHGARVAMGHPLQHRFPRDAAPGTHRRSCAVHYPCSSHRTGCDAHGHTDEQAHT